MLKVLLFFLVLGTVPNRILRVATAKEYSEFKGSSDITRNPRIESTSENDEFISKDLKNTYKKKYHKDLDEKKAPIENWYYEENQKWEHKKKKESEKFVNAKDFDDAPRSGKYSKYNKPENSYENPEKNKNVNYHDKHSIIEKGKGLEENYQKEVFQDTLPISLHHDIDVNYLDNKDNVARDAEFINIEDSVKIAKEKEYIQNAVHEKKDKYSFYKNLKKIDLTSIPSTNNSALIARYIIHNVEWTAIGSLSTNIKIKGSPFVNIISVSDGPVDVGSGVPFFYMTPKDLSTIDLEKDNRCTIAATLAQTDFCKNKNLDPESPLCARLLLSGKVKKIKPGTEEEIFAKHALFSRHPDMKNWPADHNWFFAKLKIKQILLFNHFGGASNIRIQDYFDV